MSSPSDRRVSDAEREAAVEVLGAAYAAGRLDAEDHQDRVELALVARTRGDLEDLTRDLEPSSSGTPNRAPRRPLSRALPLTLAVVAVAAVAGGVGYLATTGEDEPRSTTTITSHTDVDVDIDQDTYVMSSGPERPGSDVRTAGVGKDLTQDAMSAVVTAYRARFGDAPVMSLTMETGLVNVLVLEGDEPGVWSLEADGWREQVPGVPAAFEGEQGFLVSDLDPAAIDREANALRRRTGAAAGKGAMLTVRPDDGRPSVWLTVSGPGGASAQKTFTLR